MNDANLIYQSWKTCPSVINFISTRLCSKTLYFTPSDENYSHGRYGMCTKEYENCKYLQLQGFNLFIDTI